MKSEEQNKIDCFKAFCEQDSSKVLEMFLVVWNKLQQQFKLDIPFDYCNYLDMIWLEWTDGWCEMTLYIYEYGEINFYYKYCDKDSSNLIETTYDEILNNGLPNRTNVPKEILEQLEVFRVK